tara:strand:- start:410 stop:637 length:228 start_codon:yes stop_codon:yes gene_type:complete
MAIKLNTAYKCSDCSKSLYNVDEIAKLLNVHPRTILRWVNSGDLKAFNLRGYYFTEEQIKDSFRITGYQKENIFQ